MNLVEIIGNITKDIELKETSTGVKYTRFSIAVNRPTKNEEGEYETDFFNVIAWRKTAEFISNYFGKGRKIAIVGRLQQNSYDDNEGNHRTSVEIVANEVYFLDKKKDTEANAEPVEAPTEEPKTDEDVFAEFGDSVELSEDDFDVAF